MTCVRGVAVRLMVAVFVATCVIGFSQQGVASDGTRDSLFHDIEERIREAKGQRADIYAPDAFEDAMDAYEEALDDFNKGKDLKGIRKDLKKADAYIDRALEVCVTADVTFKSVMKAREDAAQVSAAKHSEKLADQADATFRRAVSKLEGGDVDEAREVAERAEALYREAELDTIKKNLLSSTREKVERYEDLGRRNNAPKTFAKAARLLEGAEKELDRQRYNNAKAVTLVKEAEDELAHTDYMHDRVSKLIKEDSTFEDVIIHGEKQLTKLGDAMGVTLKFDNGISGAVFQLLDAVQELKASADAKDRKIASLRAKVTALETKVARLSTLEQDLLARKHEAEDALKRQKESQRLKQMKIQRIRQMFAPEEGKVLMDGDNIIIRLYGLSFPSGKAVIDYRYFGLLAKVRDTFEEFPGCSVVIEGHTDSLGSEKVNKRLSKERADSVRHYLIANSSVTDDRISAVGYGESKPVASNETREGRASNRRIDVVIIPDKG